MTAARRIMARFGWGVLAVVVLAGVAGGLIWGYLGRSEPSNGKEEEQAVMAPRRASIVNGEPVVTLDAALQRDTGIETMMLRTTAYNQQLRAYGTVLDLQPLTELSNRYATAVAARQTAQAKLAASRMAFDRASKLYREQQNVSAAQLQSAEAAFRIDQAALAAADAQLATLQVSVQQAWGVVLGQALVDKTPIFSRLIERRDVLIQVTLPPSEFVAKPPTEAAVQLPDGRHASLQFLSLGTRTDPRIQGLSFFYMAPADTGLLPGMNVLAFLPSDKPIAGALVPASAVVWWQGRAWAYVKAGADIFIRREIPTDVLAPEGGYVVPQIADASEVVTRGAQLLLSEELRGNARSNEEGNP